MVNHIDVPKLGTMTHRVNVNLTHRVTNPKAAIGQLRSLFRERR